MTDSLENQDSSCFLRLQYWCLIFERTKHIIDSYSTGIFYLSVLQSCMKPEPARINLEIFICIRKHVVH